MAANDASAPSEHDILMAMTLVGNTNTGKTCLLRQCVYQEFAGGIGIPTIGADFGHTKGVVGGVSVKLRIWDVTGILRFRLVSCGYTELAHGVLFVFDLTNKESFDDIKASWLERVAKDARPAHVKALVGNKSDLPDQRAVSREEAEAFAAEHNMEYFETTAKSYEAARATIWRFAEALLPQALDEEAGRRFSQYFATSLLERLLNTIRASQGS